MNIEIHHNCLSIKQITMVFLIVMMEPVSAQVNKNTFQPATFSESRHSLRHNIKFPKVDEDIQVIIRCYGWALRRGRLGTNYCASIDEEDRPFERAVLKAANIIVSMNPAKVNNRRVQVWIQYSVLFNKASDEETIYLFHHHFFNHDELGSDYISAQLYHTENISMFSYCTQGLIVKTWITMSIDEKGKTGNIKILEPERVSDLCLRKAFEYVSTSRYIPAFHEGKPVVSKYMDVYFNSMAVVH